MKGKNPSLLALHILCCIRVPVRIPALSGVKARTMVLIKLFMGNERNGRDIFQANAPGRFKELPIKVLNAVANDCT